MFMVSEHIQIYKYIVNRIEIQEVSNLVFQI